MADQQYTESVSAHYTSGDLGERILAGLRATGKDPDNLHIDDLDARRSVPSRRQTRDAATDRARRFPARHARPRCRRGIGRPGAHARHTDGM